jgi:hypothetical protein
VIRLAFYECVGQPRWVRDQSLCFRSGQLLRQTKCGSFSHDGKPLFCARSVESIACLLRDSLVIGHIKPVEYYVESLFGKATAWPGAIKKALGQIAERLT